VTTRLRPLRDDEIAAYVPHLTTTYATELTEHLFLDAEAAAARAERSATDAFPDGVAAPGHWLFAVEDGEGTRVGVLWLGEPFDGEPDALWVYDIEIDPDHRGRGLGRDTMLLAEAEARRLGRSRIKLNVFARNAVARALYLSLGFEEMSVQMSKAVDGGGLAEERVHDHAEEHDDQHRQRHGR
jgi:ribosomal protein S18 acetylase RimI-like enzyme